MLNKTPFSACRSGLRLLAALIIVTIASAPPAVWGLRVVNWNVTNFEGSSSRDNAFRTAIYGVYQTRSMSPDILIGQEFITASSVTWFTYLLNTATGSPGDWAAAPFVDGPDTDNAFFYRSSLMDLMGTTEIYRPSGSSADQPRSTMRYDVRLKGYPAGLAPYLALYSCHMKAGSAGDDQSRRLLEARRIRDNAETLPLTWMVIVGGDFNTQSSNQTAFTELVGTQTNNNGRFKDPINSPGDWNNNSAFRFLHTQDPMGAGGMDDRHDHLLISTRLADGKGFDYLGSPTAAYSTTTWNDPNHSFRAWGNDGTTFDAPIKVSGNTMVGATVAQALRDSTGNANPSSTGGHLPVLLDLLVPPQVAVSPAVVDLGDVVVGNGGSASLTVLDVADAIWNSAFVSTLHYTLSATAPFAAPSGTLTALAGTSGKTSLITATPVTLGPETGTVTITSDAQNAAALAVPVRMNGIPVASTLIDKTLPDGTVVHIAGLVATACFKDFFYAETTDRAAGIRVEKDGHSVTEGLVRVAGTLRTNANYERYIDATTAHPAGTGSVEPLALNNYKLGNQSWKYNTQSGAGQRGVDWGWGLNNFGLLVRTWGQVVQVDTSLIPSWFVIDDGSAVGIRVVLPPGIEPPDTGAGVTVTGANSCYLSDGSVYSQILVRRASDIKLWAD